MTSIKQAQYALVVNLVCFAYGFALLVGNFTYLDGPFNHSHTILESLLSDVYLYISWNVAIYFVYGISLFVLSLSFFNLTRKVSPDVAIAMLIIGSIWSGFMLLSGGISIEAIHQISKLYPENSQAAIDLWLMLGVIQESVGGGNELVGSIWISLVSLLLVAEDKLSRTTKWIGFSIAIIGLGTLVESGDVFASLFGVAFIAWFLLMIKVLPLAFAVQR
ncbi:hypothetical protein ACXJY6_07815 [Vibrio sp. RC27]